METAQTERLVKRKRGVTLWNLSLGHGVAHWYGESLPVLLPYIQATMGFSNVQYGLLGTFQGISSAVANIPGGVIVDRLKRHWGPILAWCMVWSAISFSVLGVSPNYLVLVFAVMLVGLPGTIWHLPASASLSQSFPDRRGFALSMHGMGASMGNFLGPIATGALLEVLLWRHIALIYAAPAVALAIFFWFYLRNLGRPTAEEEGRPLALWIRDAARMLRNPLVIALLVVALLRTGVLNAIMFWTPRYLKDPVEAGGLGMEPAMVGFYFALVAGMGIVSTPILGMLSDRLGRKAILVPGLVVTALLPIALVNVSPGPLLALIMVVLGFFTFPLQQVLLAAVLDVVGRGTEATSTGLLFGGGAVVAAVSPLLAALVVNSFGLGAIFYYIAIISTVGAAVMLAIPLKKQHA